MKGAALLFAALLVCASARAGWNPKGWEAEPRPDNAANPSALAVAENSLLALYRNVLGPVNPGKCPSSPTCSAYCQRSVNLYGPITGVVLTANRLLGEGDEARFSPIVYTDKPRVYSPPERDYEFLTGGR